MKKMKLAGGQITAYVLITVFTLFFSATNANAVQLVSNFGSKDAAQSACIAEGLPMPDFYGGSLCQHETYMGARRVYFSFCSLDDKRRVCGHTTVRHLFTFPVPYGETVTEQIYETGQDLYAACNAELAAQLGYPNVRCKWSVVWKNSQGQSIGYTNQITGYRLYYQGSQATPSWGNHTCTNLYAWHGNITWCQQTSLRAYFGGCPAGSKADPANFNKCEIPADDPYKDNGSPCETDGAYTGLGNNKRSASASSMVGNPCHAGTGNKYEAEVDFTGALSLTRSYNSLGQQDVGFGMGWTSNLHKSLSVFGNTLLVHEADGRSEKWTRVSDVWRGDADSRLIIEEVTAGFVLTRANGNYESYDANGKLLAEFDANGNMTDYQYDANGRLTDVQGLFGHTIHLGYDANNHISRVNDSAGTEFRYSYSGENLASVRVVMQGDPTRTYLYEDSRFPHHLTGLIDENGDRYADWAYDGDGKAILTTHALTTNSVGQQRYDLVFNGNETQVTDADGNASTWVFDENLSMMRLRSKLSLVDAKGITRDFDIRNNLVEHIDRGGRKTTYSYNAANQRTSMTEATGALEARTTNYAYVDPDTDLVTRVVGPSVYHGQQSETVITYNTSLNPTSVTTSGYDPSGQPVSRGFGYNYNSKGLLTRYDGPRADLADVLQIEYYECDTGSECGRPARVTNAAGHVTNFDTYDPAGRLTQSTDANGVITRYDFDARGRVVSVTLISPDGESRTTAFDYDLADQVTTITTADAISLTLGYDAAHDLRSVEDNLGNRVEYTYDARGNRQTVSIYDLDNTLARQADLVYGLRNYLESVNVGGSITQWLNDAEGNPVEQTDPNYNPSTRFDFDSLDRLRESIDAAGNYTNFEYDVADNLVRVMAPNGAETRYSVDDLGNQLSEESPDRGPVTKSYDEAGNVVSSTDARGITVSHEYDELNRLLETIYPNPAENTTYKYDECEFGTGRLCRTIDPGGITSYSYDAWGNIATMVREEAGQRYTTTYRYDAGNRVIQIVDPAGLQVDYTRDDVGRVADVSYTYRGVTNTLSSAREYRADGALTGQVLGNGLQEIREYDLQGRLTSQELRTTGSAAEDISNDAAAVDTRTYSYDANGNLLDIDVTPDLDLPKAKTSYATPDPSWSYDVLDRVIGDTGIESHEYDYDSNGNLIYRHKLDKKKGTIYSYSSLSNQLELIGDTEVVMDAAGNTLSDNNGERSFTYNQRGRLESISKNGILKAAYQYNAYSQRTAKQLFDYQISEGIAAEADLHHYHYGLDGMMIAEHANGVPKRSYVWVGGQPVAQVEYKGSGQISRVTYITTDHLATPRIGTSTDGVVVWRWDSDAYGSRKPNSNPDGKKGNVKIQLRFPGQYHDEESGLFYNWNRYYDSGTGRYITSDPIGLDGGLNTFLYVGGNPINSIDPLGLFCVLPRNQEVLQCFKRIDDVFPDATIPGDELRCAGGDLSSCSRDQSVPQVAGYGYCILRHGWKCEETEPSEAEAQPDLNQCTAEE